MVRHVPHSPGLTPAAMGAEAAMLAAMLDPESFVNAYEDSDLTVLWRQQLASRIAEHIANRAGGAAGAELVAWCETSDPQVISFGQLLAHPSPLPGLVDAVRRGCKRRIAPNLRSGLAPIACMAYYATIAAGICAGHPHPTGLGDAGLRTAMRWSLSRGWIDERTRWLFRRACEIRRMRPL